MVLVSNRSLNTEEDSEVGITLISKKKLDSSDFDGKFLFSPSSKLK